MSANPRMGVLMRARAAYAKELARVTEQFDLTPAERLAILHDRLTGIVNELLRADHKEAKP